MKLRSFENSSQGIALIIVMIVIIVLGILAGGFAYSMKVETTLARRANFDPDLQWLGRSGVEMARYILAQQMAVPNEPYDSLNQKWAGGPGSVYSMTNEALSQVSLQNNELGKGRFSIKITDLERKFNVNVADQTILQQALFLVGLDPASSSTIVDSILDWRDLDEEPHLNGTESDYYLGLDPPYVSKNGPIDDLSELLLIRGITPDIYWGSQRQTGRATGRQIMSVDPEAFQMGSPQVGLEQLFTSISGRLINVNTASTWVLQLVPGLDENMAQAIIRARAGPDGLDGTEDDIPFRSAQEIPMPGAGPQSAARLNSLFTVARSATFQVQVDAEIGQAKKQFVAVLRRNSARDIQMLYMHEE